MTKIVDHGLPARLVRGDRSYQLVALLEGADANAQFMRNLQVLGRQRQQLAELRRRLEALPADAPEPDRAALQAQIDPLAAQVAKNLEFMTRHYGYSVRHDYLLSPVRSALLRRALDEQGKPVADEAKAELIAELHTAVAYEELQVLRERAAALAADPAKKPEFETAKTTLRERFGFEFAAHHILQVRKGALYATVDPVSA